MTAVIAELTHVSKSYGSTVALGPLDLTLESGVIGLLGPNGAGKSTLLRVLATAMPATSGRVRLGGHDVAGSIGQRTEARRHLGYLPQEVGFPRGMTAFGFLDYIAVLKEWNVRLPRHREVQRVLDLVNLEDLGRKRVRSLSGGQRRRLALAQAFIGSPDLVILDEPTTGLDPEQRASLRGVLSEHARHRVVVLATHQTEDVSALCDRVIVLDDGRIRFDGTVAELVGTAVGRVWVGESATTGALTSWRTGAGSVRSVGGDPGPDSRPAEPAVEDAYLLMRGESDPTVIAEGDPS
jgi:ABC-2 type transport system ATP-binding protein